MWRAAILRTRTSPSTTLRLDGPKTPGDRPNGPMRELPLLAQLTPNRPAGEVRSAVHVHVVGRRVLSDGLDKATVDAGGASADGARSPESPREQGDHDRTGHTRRRHVDVGGEHRAVDVLPAHVEADGARSLIEDDRRATGCVGIPRPGYLGCSSQRGGERPTRVRADRARRYEDYERDGRHCCKKTASHGASFPRASPSAAEDLVDRAVVERNHEQVSVGSGFDVCDDAEVTPDQQTLTLGEVVERQVVGDPVLEPRIVDGDLVAIAGEVEPEKRAAEGFRNRDPNEQVAEELRPEGSAGHEPDAGGGENVLPAELGFAVVRAEQHEQPRERLPRRVGDPLGPPPELLQVGEILVVE